MMFFYVHWRWLYPVEWYFPDIRWTGRTRPEDIMAGIDTSRTVGWFTNLYLYRLKQKTGRDIGYALRSIKEQLRKIPAKGIGLGIEIHREIRYCNRKVHGMWCSTILDSWIIW
ncbi:hypothetical protein CS542_09090 [Pedobacter sp. IW39]|nr:hypothetical protein CS542_09090 [Pedobacter sp. IW39]